jgi:hypothetical protein
MGHYSGGILSYSNCTEGTNHGVLAVGYGENLSTHSCTIAWFVVANILRNSACVRTIYTLACRDGSNKPGSFSLLWWSAALVLGLKPTF